MREHVCPWWGGYFIDNRFRRFLHKPEQILAPYVRNGMSVLDFGCGMGFFSIPLARMVGPDGVVIAADLQPQMLRTLRKRAERAGVSQRIRTLKCTRDSIGIEGAADFVLAFWSAHETPDIPGLLAEFHGSLVKSGRMFIAEPRGHVTQADFQRIVSAAEATGFTLDEQPVVRLSRAAFFRKS